MVPLLQVWQPFGVMLLLCCMCAKDSYRCKLLCVLSELKFVQLYENSMNHGHKQQLKRATGES